MHDLGSAIHPLALASPFFAEFDLRARGVGLAVPEISYANPLPGRPAAIGYHDLERTCAGLEHGDVPDRQHIRVGPLVITPEIAVAEIFPDARRIEDASLPASLALSSRIFR